jgi:RHS repeat-associated protein
VTLKYGYDALGSLTNLWSTTANGVTNVYRYDLLGRLTNVLAGATSAANYGYDVVGNLQSLRYANAVTNLYQYDSRNRLTRLVWQSGNTSLASFAYTVGPTGNRTALAETVNGTSRTYNWGYDYLYRMTGETFSGSGYPTPQSVLYGFDPVGNRTNRTSAVSGIGSQTPSYTANDWLASDTSDANGNTTVSGTTNYQYDVMNHLVNVNNGQILLTYDGDGNRVSKTVNGLTTYYLVDDRNPSGYAQVLEEYTSLNQQPVALSRVYNYGLALISQRQVASGAVSYFGTDGHGGTRFLTDANANLTDTYAFDAYGLLIASTGSTPDNYLYWGQQWDSDLGFYYLRARYYKPDTGRFWTMDTYAGDSGDPLSLHKYLYCQGSPVDNDDPSGLASTVAAQNGVAVHQYIGDDFTGQGIPGTRFSGPSVVSTLESIPGFKLPPKFQGVVTALFPDLTDTLTQEVYEIKPDNGRSIVTGEAQLQTYIDVFNLLDPRKGWHRGTSYKPPLTVTINALNYAVAVGSPATPPGLILYHVFSVQKIVQKKVVQAAVADNADLADSIGISTLTTVIAF